jgi:YD repeat-containing protein
MMLRRLICAVVLPGMIVPTGLAHASETVRYGYDAQGRLAVADSRTSDGKGYAAGYGFDRAANRITYQNAKVVRVGELPPDASLAVGEGMISPDKGFRFTLQYDGNLVLYAGPTQPVWATHSYQPANASLVMQGDGNLVLYSNGQGVWHTNTWGHPGARLHVQNDGNLVVYDVNGIALWSRF